MAASRWRQLRWRFDAGQWFVANIVAAVLAGCVAALAYTTWLLLEFKGDFSLPCFGVVPALCAGLVLGLVQAQVLRGLLGRRRQRWVWATTMAAALIALVLVIIGDAAEWAWWPLLPIVGAAQSFVLRGLVKRPWRWAVFDSIGRLVGFAPAVPLLRDQASCGGPFVLVALVGLASSLATGKLLMRFADEVVSGDSPIVHG